MGGNPPRTPPPNQDPLYKYYLGDPPLL